LLPTPEAALSPPPLPPSSPPSFTPPAYARADFFEPLRRQISHCFLMPHGLFSSRHYFSPL